MQSNYVPWKGYFDLINSVDEFVLYDDAQYTKNDWRNRNKIKTDQGVQWLSIPVRQLRLAQTIRETEVASNQWRAKHWKTLTHAYGACPHFAAVAAVLEPLYLRSEETRLSAVNHAFIEAINRFLGITTKLRWSSEFQLAGDRNERLVGLCRQAGADTYLTGPSALAYLNHDMFAQAGIAVEVASYTGYPQYPQLHPPFEHGVSVVDLMFNAGRRAGEFMKSFAADDSEHPFTLPLDRWLRMRDEA